MILICSCDITLDSLNVNLTQRLILSPTSHLHPQKPENVRTTCRQQHSRAFSDRGEHGDNVSVACCVDRRSVQLGRNQFTEARLGVPHLAHYPPYPRLQLEEWHVCTCRGGCVRQVRWILKCKHAAMRVLAMSMHHALRCCFCKCMPYSHCWCILIGDVMHARSNALVGTVHHALRWCFCKCMPQSLWVHSLGDVVIHILHTTACAHPNQ